MHVVVVLLLSVKYFFFGNVAYNACCFLILIQFLKLVYIQNKLQTLKRETPWTYKISIFTHPMIIISIIKFFFGQPFFIQYFDLMGLISTFFVHGNYPFTESLTTCSITTYYCIENVLVIRSQDCHRHTYLNSKRYRYT